MRDWLWVREHEDTGRVINDVFNDIHSVDGLDPTLDHASSLGICSELVDELLDVLDLFVLRLLLLLLELILLTFNLFEVVEVTLVVGKLLVEEVDDFVNCLIKEVSCVRNDEHCDV